MKKQTAMRASIAGLRWYILALIFIVTCINFMDRSSIGLLFPVFGPELGISTRQYGYVSSLLLAAYAISQSGSGKFYDRFGARIGFTVSIIVWCTAAIAHSMMRGVWSFAACSFFLGIGEAGNWPGAAKVIAEWFPQKERAMGMAVFNSGSSLGGVAAPLVVAAWLYPTAGWRVTFVIIGSLGFGWLLLWLFMYRPLFQHPRLSSDERAHIRQGQAALTVEDIPHQSIIMLLRKRQTWGIIIARGLVDPIWWLYMLWLPTYLKEAHHLSIKSIGLSAWLPYFAAALGALTGGWLAGKLIRRGASVTTARKVVTICAALLMPSGILAARVSSPITAILLISVVLFGFQMWISNVQTLPSDFFSHRTVGAVAGLGGSAAGLASLAFNLLTAPLAAHFGYESVITIAGLLGPVGALALWILCPRVERLEM